ncbi:lytic transglycosylase [Litoribrevibacter albus]|uniref:Lytic transglycosylase n=2 Tax=Litoribrevibacter albus TaxID=1473156 RepID=A0AA37S870_9GAMM|nr:lytic transglycosylase [Litoribrevibacter albus]
MFLPTLVLAKLSHNQQTYIDALDALKDGQVEVFDKLSHSLSDYVLSPYLEYERIKLNDYQDIEAIKAFILKYPDQSITHRLKVEWLSSFPKKEKWQAFLDNYDENLYSRELRCYYLRALYKTGKQQAALKQTKDMWVVGRSAPKACDPIFKVWLTSSYFKSEYAYERVKLALARRKTSLASYSTNFLKGDQKQAAAMMIWAHKNPAILSSTKRFPTANPYMKDAIIHGLKRRVRKQPDAALAYWKKHRNRFNFSPEEIHKVEQRIYLGLARQYDKNASKLLSSLRDEYNSEEVLEWQIRVSLRNRDWPSVVRWIEQLSQTKEMDSDWHYWHYKAYLKQDQEPPQIVKQNFTKLSKERSYYGFLASEMLGQSLTLTNIPVPISQDMHLKVQNLPEINRAKELLAIGHRQQAHKEWQFAVNKLDQQGLMALARVASDWGWHNRAIRAVIDANHWNDLAIRFPTPYQSTFGKAATKVELPSSWLFAIARQESAFSEQAQSSAGARGLMQLMPATARQTARKIGISSRSSLYDPDYNIRLGSSYLSMMHKRFKKNRALATAAYNAGPHRVDSWIKSSTALPIDVWIETIPYDETRRYVKNVLAFDAIYQYKLGQKEPKLFYNHEKIYLGKHSRKASNDEADLDNKAIASIDAL